MASTPPPRIEISGIDDASLKDLYHSVARIDAESHGAERKSDKFCSYLIPLRVNAMN
jgi:hypothetical protein